MISSDVRKAGPYTANGATTVFPFTFKVFEAEDVQVVLTVDGVETVATTGFVTTLNGSQDTSPGGTVTFTVAPASGLVTLTSAIMATQPMQITNGGGFFPRVLNDSADRQTILIQQLKERVDRTLAAPISSDEPIDGLVIPPADERAGKILTFDVSGRLIAGDSSTGPGDGGLRTDLAVDGGPLVAVTAPGVGAVAEDLATFVSRTVWAEQYGAVGVSMAEFNALSSPAQVALATANSAAILRAVVALRREAVTLTTDGLTPSVPITAYASGELNFGGKTFPFLPDTLNFTQELGLIFKGQGSRKTNNSVRGQTTLLIIGNGSYGIRVMGNGARGMVIQDMDICYEGNSFTGYILDNFSSPGFIVTRSHIGTNGITGGTRYQTAAGMLRATYDEFINLIDVAFDGGVDGILFDNTRQPPIGSNEFGGSGTRLESVVFYDFTGTMIKSDGVRNRKKLKIDHVTFNPIAVDCSRAIDLNNVDALSIEAYFTPSTSSKATNGWMRIVNCTGSIRDSEYLGQCAVGSVSGNLTITNNTFASDAGITLAGGIITAYGNEFSQGTLADPVGYSIPAPSLQLTFTLGPDIFKAGMGRSYDVSADDADLEGRIIYSATQDASTNRFRNMSARVAIEAVDSKAFSVSATTYTVLPWDTGRVVNLTSPTGCTVTLPAVANTLGCKFRFMANTGQIIVIQGPAGTLYVGGGAAKTSMTSGAGDYGVFAQIENRAGVYNNTARIGSFTFA